MGLALAVLVSIPRRHLVTSQLYLMGQTERPLTAKLESWRTSVNPKFILTMLLILFSSVVNGANIANRKTDIVTFYNGDQLTGEIK